MLQQIQFNQNRANNQNQVMPMRNRISFGELQRTLLGLKPDAYEKGLAGQIKNEILAETGLKVVMQKIKVQSREMMGNHYAHHSGKAFFEGLIDYVTRGKFGAYVLEGDDAVVKLRDTALNLREKYGVVGQRENLIHSSDSAEAAENEIGKFFSKEA